MIFNGLHNENNENNENNDTHSLIGFNLLNYSHVHAFTWQHWQLATSPQIRV